MIEDETLMSDSQESVREAITGEKRSSTTQVSPARRALNQHSVLKAYRLTVRAWVGINQEARGKGKGKGKGGKGSKDVVSKGSTAGAKFAPPVRIVIYPWIATVIQG